MGLSLGIVGLPNVGKSTIFTALSRYKVEIAPYPFSTIEPNISVVPVPDERLSALSKVVPTISLTPSFIKFIDIAGLVKGASKGEGLGNQFLSHIREVSAIIEVVRCFSSKDAPHILSDIDPKRDIEIIETELILSDLETVGKRISKIKKPKDASEKKMLEILKELHFWLSKGKPARDFEKIEELSDLNLLSQKPMIYVFNIGEEEDYRLPDVSPSVKIFGKFELELLDLDEEERKSYRETFGIEDGISKLIKESYRILDLITFYTTKRGYVRAWAIKRGTTAQKAAGKIHSDMEKGFIKAEVINIETLLEVGSEEAARKKGLFRTEGKEYKIKDGDVVLFKFS